MKIRSDRYYKIRHIETGLYKTSGHNGKFNKTGKTWLGATIKRHLAMFEEYTFHRENPKTLCQCVDDKWKNDFNNKFTIEECEIIELELTETGSQPIKEFIEGEM
jgi:hypothetical protein